MNKFADTRFLQANEAPRPNGRGIFSPLLRRERHRKCGIPLWRENPSEAPLGGAKGDKFLIKNILSQKGLVDLFALLGIAIMLITLPAANKLLSERQEIRKQAQSTVCPIGCCGGECGTCPSGQSCDIQNGACSSGLSCNPQGYGTHLACRDNQCVWEPGDGAPECSTNEECEQKQQEVCKANECCGTGVKCNSAGTACNVADSNCGKQQVCWPENCCAEGYKCRPDGSACDVASTLCKSTPHPLPRRPLPQRQPLLSPPPQACLLPVRVMHQTEAYFAVIIPPILILEPINVTKDPINLNLPVTMNMRKLMIEVQRVRGKYVSGTKAGFVTIPIDRKAPATAVMLLPPLLPLLSQHLLQPQPPPPFPVSVKGKVFIVFPNRKLILVFTLVMLRLEIKV